MTLTKALIVGRLACSHAEARRKISEGAIRVNGIRRDDPAWIVPDGEHTIHLGPKKIEAIITVF